MAYFKNATFTNKAAQRFEFDIENLDIAIVNGIRRVILSDIPVYGFQGEAEGSIVIHKNNGPLHNEFMSHRIGLLPIHIPEDNTDTYIFTCDVKNESADSINVTTKNLTGTRNDQPLTEKELSTLFPANPITKQNVLITRLRRGEELAFTATAVKKTAKDHASFSPVSLCSFYYVQDPAKANETTNILDKERAYFKNEYGEASLIRFMIEPELALSPSYLVTKAIQILIDKLTSLNYTTTLNTSMPNTIDMHISNQTDTIGNLLQSLLFNEFVRKKNKLAGLYDVTFVGYFAPHPLEENIVLRMSLGEDKTLTLEEFQQYLLDAIQVHVTNQVKQVLDAWMRFDVRI